MTAPAYDTSGLASDNVADDPSGRVGPEKPPLKAGAWNTMTVALEGKTVALTLNGETIYRRALEPGNSRQFGLYHAKDQTSARVRNVVLRGRWPESVPDDLGASLASAPATAETARRANYELIGEPILGRGADEVLSRAAGLEPGPRYESLAAWVVPGPDHPVFRLQGVFSPTTPVAGPGTPPERLKGKATRVLLGGEVRAPALELVEAAQRAGKLDDLAARVASAEANDPLSRRGKQALEVLIAIARDDDEAAGAALGRLKPLLEAMPLEPTEWGRWPEFVAATRAIPRPPLRGRALALLDVMAAQAQKVGVGRIWENQVKNLRARGRLLAAAELDPSPFEVPPELPHWASVVQTRAETRGGGAPRPAWIDRDGALTHHPGHALDMLYLDVPLRGDFQLDCELTGFGWRELRISYGGLMVGPKYDLKHVIRAHYGRNLPDVAVTPPLEKLGEWYRYRLVVKGGSMTSFVNDRQVFQATLPAGNDPWLALYCEGHLTGGVRNLKISGSPTVPRSLTLAALPDLTGWRPDEYGESVTGDNPNWEKRGDEIVGRRLGASGARFLSAPTPPSQGGDATRGSYQESVLRYHRPLLEDGELTYEFYYEPGEVMVHPAIDRLALILEPDGIKRHWLTDAQYERTGLAPDNASVEPECRRGPAKLPLRPKSWNRATLSLAGDRIRLSLNDETIYERTLEPTNQRTFGLFHFAGETEVRVRNVTYRGEWPAALPSGLLEQAPPSETGRPSKE
jgi:hypothetical protein